MIRSNSWGHVGSHFRDESYKLKRQTERSKLKQERKNSHHHPCKYCGKVFKTGQQLVGHTVLCELNPNSKKHEN